MPAGSLTINGTLFNFLVARPDKNFPIDSARNAEETLTVNGIDGKRWRILSEQLAQFGMDTITECADFAAAVQLTRSYLDTTRQNPIAKLVHVSNAATYSFKNVHIAGCDPTPLLGQVVGGGAAANTAHVRCTWVIDLTEFVFSVNQ